jgi:hypothetical protein
LPYNDWFGKAYLDGVLLPINTNTSVEKVALKTKLWNGIYENANEFIPGFSLKEKAHIVLGDEKSEVFVALRRGCPFGIFYLKKGKLVRVQNPLSDNDMFDWFDSDGFNIHIEKIQLDIEFLRFSDSVFVQFTDKLGRVWNGECGTLAEEIYLAKYISA